MKKLKFLLSYLVLLYISYIVYLYATSRRESYIFSRGFEGVVLISFNSSEGSKLDEKDLKYDFIKSNILKIKNNYEGGMSPMGLTNYYAAYGNEPLTKICVEDGKPNAIRDDSTEIKVWSVSKKVGACNDKKYLTFIIASSRNYVKLQDQQWDLLNRFCSN